MNTFDYKKEIVSKIELTNDDDVLSVVYDILQNGLPIDEDVLQNESFLKSIERGLDDIKHGRVISNEQANIEIEAWLNK